MSNDEGRRQAEDRTPAEGRGVARRGSGRGTAPGKAAASRRARLLFVVLPVVGVALVVAIVVLGVLLSMRQGGNYAVPKASSTVVATALRPGETPIPHVTGKETLPPAGMTAKWAGSFLPMNAAAVGDVMVYESASGAVTLGFRDLISSGTPDTLVWLSSLKVSVHVTSEQVSASNPVTVGAMKFHAGTFTMPVPAGTKVTADMAVYLWDPKTNSVIGGASLHPPTT